MLPADAVEFVNDLCEKSNKYCMVIGTVDDFESPADFARPYAESIGIGSDFNPEFIKNITLPYLDMTASKNKLLGTYFVETSRAMSIPASFEADDSVGVWDFDKLSFEGRFATHSLVQIGKINDYQVRALCLSFSEALLLPFFDEIPEEHILHIPVVAIDDMSRTG